jgi:hypothetical protein
MSPVTVQGRVQRIMNSANARVLCVCCTMLKELEVAVLCQGHWLGCQYGPSAAVPVRRPGWPSDSLAVSAHCWLHTNHLPTQVIISVITSDVLAHWKVCQAGEHGTTNKNLLGLLPSCNTSNMKVTTLLPSCNTNCSMVCQAGLVGAH